MRIRRTNRADYWGELVTLPIHEAWLDGGKLMIRAGPDANGCYIELEFDRQERNFICPQAH